MTCEQHVSPGLSFVLDSAPVHQSSFVAFGFKSYLGDPSPGCFLKGNHPPKLPSSLLFKSI